jgi:hypothetical protein
MDTIPSMTTDGAELGAGLVRLGLRRFDRLFNGIVGGFGVLYALQTADSLVADLPSMSNPVGVVVMVLAGVAVLAGVVPFIAPTRARAAFLIGTVLFGNALLLWPIAIEPPIPTDPMPWLCAIWPVAAAYAAQSAHTRLYPVLGTAVFSAYAGAVLWLADGMDLADAAVNAGFMLCIALALALLLGFVRRGVLAAAEAQQAALTGFTSSRFDDATEEERKRTDALMHDAVLTTFLAAASAQTPESEDLARRMAANSLRVLMHVNGLGRNGAVVPFGQAFAEQRGQLASALRPFDTDLGAAESVMLPADVARAIIDLLLASLRFSAQQSPDATLRLCRAEPLGADGIRVTVEDDGSGFDMATIRQQGDGDGLDAVDRLRALEGRVDVRSAPGEGMSLVVSWGSVVMTGTALLPEELSVQS